MKWGRAISAGIVGALAMTAGIFILRTVGITQMNSEMMLGSMMMGKMAASTWLLGLMIHLMFGAIFGIAYGWIMEGIQRRGPGIGLAIGFAHAIFSGLLMPVMMSMHPAIRSGQMPPPGVFAANMGFVAVLIFFGEHLLYGSIVGSIYQLRHAAKTEPEEMRTPRRPPTAVIRG